METFIFICNILTFIACIGSAFTLGWAYATNRNLRFKDMDKELKIGVIMSYFALVLGFFSLVILDRIHFETSKPLAPKSVIINSAKEKDGTVKNDTTYVYQIKRGM